MKEIHLYLRAVAALIVFCLSIGFVLPALFSARNTLAVQGGILFIVAIPVVVWRYRNAIRNDIKIWKQLFKEFYGDE